MHESVCDLLLDLVQNSIEAKASLIELSFDEDERQIAVTLRDNGCGMSKQELERAKDPFYSDGTKHRQRKVGLGIPFLLQMVEQVDGTVEIVSEKGKGTCISFVLPKDNIDLPPIGALPAFLLPALTWSSEYEMVFRRSLKSGDDLHRYEITRSELADALGDFRSASSLSLLRTFLISQEDDRD
ncbi:ATP-binding protein [Sediminispirochaeta smaragdinae]|jgi:hypothetical protein|uniref:histidine kinase n=1 Tax=Sediminispirochaeta smaragdinae (strain DSM 11293 / JCM 15392 / SEBR 4228) TaxID=573413 RepID=E1R7S1_SEDSS|nr:ATP-binding protein [Sediminispirochaeta smaragdinae]ADK82776.1 histidine kinase [Sediminispirochaeta smaragdinae DSM 11293]